MDLGAGDDELPQALPAAAARHAEVLAVGDHRHLGDVRAPGRDQRPDRRGLRALALRVGGVLDVGADVDRAVLGPQRGADAEAAVGRVGALHDGLCRLHEGVGPHDLIGVGVAQDALGRDLQRLGEPRDAVELLGEVGVRGGDAFELDEVTEVLDPVQVDAHVLPQQQVALLLDDRQHAEAGLERGLQRAGVVDRDQAIAALACLVGVDPVVLDQHGAARLLLAQLEATRGDTEVGVALTQEPAIASAEAEHDGQRALRVRVRRLELDVAARRGHAPDTSTFSAMDGVTVVDHVLLRRLLSILRDKDTPHRVFRETMTDAALILGYEAMRGLRGADISVETPLETTAGVRLADEVFVVAILRAGLGLVDGFLRLVPEARVGHLGMYRDEEALRPVGYYENIPSGVADAEAFVVDPMLATGGSGVQAIARLKRAGAKRLHFVCLVAAPEGVKALREAHPDVSITTATIDRQLDETGYIRPGLGDAGDRIFGTDR